MNKLISIFVFTSIIISQNVSQLGLSIGGTSAGDLSGNSVSMNAAGDRIAIGSPGGDVGGDNAGHVRIYSYVNSSWVQLGADILGEAAGDQSGFSVSLNSAGDRIAIGAPGNDGNGAGAGHTRVYQYANGTWSKLGIDLNALAGEQSGYSVSMNAVGDRVAVGAPLSTCNPNELFGCYPFGAVRIWQQTSNGGWSILGDKIVNDSGQKGGYSVSLNAAGDRVAMGIPKGGRYGIARVYGFSSNKWSKLGGDMSTNVYAEFGWSVALDSVGSRIVVGHPNGSRGGGGIGYPGRVSVFEFDNNIWSKLGETIDGGGGVYLEGGGETLGESVSINAKGNRIILGGSYRNLDKFSNPNRVSPGVVRVYDLNNGNWTETINKIVGDSLEGYFGNSVAVSADGDRFVVGAFNNNKNGENAGIVKSYEFNLQMKIAAANKNNVSIPSGSTTNDSSITLTFTSSKSTSDFTIEDIIALGGSLSAFNAVSGQAFTSVFTPSQEGTSTITVTPGAFTDASGRSNSDTSSFTWTYDITGPNMLITAKNSSGTIINNNSTTGDNSLLLTFTSNEETSTFTADDISVSGAALSDFNAISEKVYTSNLTPTIRGAITIDVAAGTFTDSIGNANLAAPQFTWKNNYEPSMSNIDDIKLEEDSSLTLTLTATDADGDAITFTALSDTSAVSTLITSSNLTLTPSPNWNGKAKISVYASDGISEDMVAFNLEVIPINDSPQAFEWVSAASDSITITKDNLAVTYDLNWTESVDVDGDTINYIMYAKIGVYPYQEIYDTTATLFPIPYAEIVEGAFEGLPGNSATIYFSIWAHDGIDSVKISRQDRVIYVNRYDYLSIESKAIPTEFALYENYPNPFNPSTQIRFDIPEMTNVTMTIYNMLGQRIKTFNMQSAPAGYHSLTWNATNDLGAPVSAGVYLYQLQTKGFVKTKKMILLK